MKLKFLGTGGGRYVTGEQRRRTAGIILDTDEVRIHIDPGPGALVYNHQEMEEPMTTDAVLVSHAHPDHSSDAEPVIEMITECAKKPGALFANETALKGYSDIEKAVSNYHQELCTRVETLEQDADFEYRGLKIECQEMFHSDPKTAGFTVSDGEKTIGFWTDTEFSDELLEFYTGCDTMVVYCTRAKGKSLRGHTSLDDVPNIVEAVEPSTVIITHFGYGFLDGDLDEQREWLDKEVDAKVIFAEDSMEFPGNRSLMDF
jgi:ribonuclease BN (tRNA processing enzyme)